MANLLAQHWDKLLTSVLSVIVAGTVGFYGGIAVVKSDIAQLSARMSSLEAKMDSVQPKMGTLDSHIEKITLLQKDFESLRQQNSLAVQTYSLLDLQVKQEQGKTLNYLENLLKQCASTTRTKNSFTQVKD